MVVFWYEECCIYLQNNLKKRNCVQISGMSSFILAEQRTDWYNSRVAIEGLTPGRFPFRNPQAGHLHPSMVETSPSIHTKLWYIVCDTQMINTRYLHMFKNSWVDLEYFFTHCLRGNNRHFPFVLIGNDVLVRISILSYDVNRYET